MQGMIRTDKEWRELLTPEQYRILRKEGTGNLRLWDFSLGANLSYNDVQKVAGYEKSASLFRGKAAALAPQDLTFGIFRIYTAYRDEDQVELSVFRKRKAAIDWFRRG